MNVKIKELESSVYNRLPKLYSTITRLVSGDMPKPQIKFIFKLFLTLIFSFFPLIECSSISKCDPCSKDDCGSNNCYEPGFIGLFNGKCKYSKSKYNFLFLF